MPPLVRGAWLAPRQQLRGRHAQASHRGRDHAGGGRARWGTRVGAHRRGFIRRRRHDDDRPDPGHVVAERRPSGTSSPSSTCGTCSTPRSPTRRPTTSPPIPGLAESWEASTDGLTYTYTPARGAAMVGRRAADRRRHRLHDQPIAGRGVAEPLRHVANLEATAIDDLTVEITSSVPDPKLPTMDVYIVPEHIYETLDADDLRATTRSTAWRRASTR